MDTSIFEDTDSFSTIMEKRREREAAKISLIKQANAIDKKRAIKMNVAVPLVCLFILLIFTFGFNEVNVDKCGCGFDSDVDSNAVSGISYYMCVLGNLICYKDVDYY